MPKLKVAIILFLSVMIFNSCATHRIVDYSPGKSYSGSIKLQPTDNIEKAFITVNDKLLVNKKKIKSVTITNVPSGDYKISFSSSSGIYKYELNETFELTVTNNETTKVITVPPLSGGYWAYIIIVGVVIPLALLAVLIAT